MKRESEPYEYLEGEFSVCVKSEEVQRPSFGGSKGGGNVLLLLPQSCPTLCDPIDGSPWGSPVPGILQARTLEWVAISFSNAWKCKVKVKLLSLVWLLATPWTAAHQAPPSMGFSRQECWSGVPLPSPENVLGVLKKRQGDEYGRSWLSEAGN